MSRRVASMFGICQGLAVKRSSSTRSETSDYLIMSLSHPQNAVNNNNNVPTLHPKSYLEK